MLILQPPTRGINSTVSGLQIIVATEIDLAGKRNGISSKSDSVKIVGGLTTGIYNFNEEKIQLQYLS